MDKLSEVIVDSREQFCKEALVLVMLQEGRQIWRLRHTIHLDSQLRVGHLGHATGDISNKPVLVAGLTPKNFPETGSLLEIPRPDLTRVAQDVADPFLVLSERAQPVDPFGILTGSFERCRLQHRANVIGVIPVVVSEVHETIALEGAVYGC